MTSLRDPFSAASKAQFEAQFDFFNSVTTQAFENASRLAALNLAASRDSVERSLGATFALMNSRDPRDFLTLGGQTGALVHSLFAYGRELLGIAGGVRPYAVPSLTLTPPQAIETVEVIERTVEAVPSATVEAAGAATQALAEAPAAVSAAAEAPAAPQATAEPVAAAAAVAEPVVVAEAQPIADALDAAVPAAVEPAPVAEPKAIAKAAGKGTARAAVPQHPAAAPLPAHDAAEVLVPELAPASSKRKK